MSLGALFLSSCAVPAVVQDYQRDSVITTIKEEVVWKDTIVFVQLPDESKDKCLPSADTSRLETSIAYSEAYLTEDGSLYHHLRNKDLLFPVETQLPKYIYSKNDNVIREKVITETIEVERELSQWQRFIMALGYGILFAIVIWLTVKFAF